MTLGYWIESPGQGALRDVDVAATDDAALELEAVCSGVSPGTERLVGLGRVPASLHASMACRGMQGTFSLPLLYGYSFVGRVRGGADAGRRAFVMRPHQQRAYALPEELAWLPDAVPDARATLFPNLETARNAVWDAAPADGERALVLGAGPVGLLCAFVLAHDRPDEPVTVVERDPARRARAAALPWVTEALDPNDVPAGAYAHALHTTATAAGLQLAIDAVGFEGQVLELSWYGDASVSLRLGESFHSQRKRLVCSQVGAVAPSQRAAGYTARRDAVLALLTDPALDALLSSPTPFERAPETFTALYESRLDALCPVLAYS